MSLQCNATHGNTFTSRPYVVDQQKQDTTPAGLVNLYCSQNACDDDKLDHMAFMNEDDVCRFETVACVSLQYSAQALLPLV